MEPYLSSNFRTHLMSQIVTLICFFGLSSYASNNLLETTRNPSNECLKFQLRAQQVDDHTEQMYLLARMYLIENLSSSPLRFPVNYSTDIVGAEKEGEIEIILPRDEVQRAIGVASSELVTFMSLAHLHNLCELKDQRIKNIYTNRFGGSSNREEVKLIFTSKISEACEEDLFEKKPQCEGDDDFECLMTKPEISGPECKTTLPSRITHY